MSSDDQETATVHDAKTDNITARTANSRSEVFILLSLSPLAGIFKTLVLTLTLIAQTA
jgi:hypothetical protein